MSLPAAFLGKGTRRSNLRVPLLIRKRLFGFKGFSSRPPVPLVFQLPGEERDGARQPLVQIDLRLPAQRLLCQRDIRAAALRIIRRLRPENDPGGGIGLLQDDAGDLQNGPLVRVSHVDRAGDVFRIHHALQRVQRVAHEAKTAGLKSVAVTGEVFAVQGLHDHQGENI